MPHAGLMDEGSMGPVNGPLMRSRLHIRGGMRRIRQGKLEAGIVTLSDALSAGIDYAIEAHHEALALDNNQAIDNERSALDALMRLGILKAGFDYDGFQQLVDEALLGRVNEDGLKQCLSGFDTIMHDLGVMPFDEALLPAENPATF